MRGVWLHLFFGGRRVSARQQLRVCLPRRVTGRGTLLFVDEIHRFNRAQQDGFLPFVEEGIVTLIGATTENPSFELNGALLSRAQVFVLKRLDITAMEKLLRRAETLTDRSLPLTPEGREALMGYADGDGRYLLNLTEEVLALTPQAPLDRKAVGAVFQKRAPAYDKSRDSHYNIISALHKSVRGSDPDAALYWLARMLDGGRTDLPFARLARGRIGARPCGRTFGDGAQIERRIYGV